MSKKTTRIAPPSMLLRELHVELDTVYSLDECVERLQHAQETRHISFSPVKVQIKTADANGVEFNLNLPALRGVKCWFIGEIKPATDSSNLVKGQVGLSPELLWFMLGLLLLPAFALIEGSVVLLTVLTLLALIMGVLFWFVAMRSRYWLIDILEDTL